MADTATLATGPPAPGALSLDTAYLSNNFASLAGTNTAAIAQASTYSRSAYSYSAPGGTVAVAGLSESEINGSGNGSATGWAGLSNTIKYVIYAAAGVVALLLVGIVIWLLVRRSRKRREQEARQNARLTTRSSFASPMHERETMQPQSANAFTNFGNPSMDDYEKPNGVYRTETNYTNGSMEKGRFNNAYADAQSVHSIPPAYSHNNGQQQRGDRGAAGDAANMSGATLLNASTNSQSSAAEHNNGTAHPMLAGINTTLSSFKPVPPPGSKPAAPAQQSRQDEPSYPPRMQSQNAIYRERSGTPSSARRQQQQYSKDDYAQQQQQQDSRSYSRNGPSQQQQQYNPRHVPPSPAYSNATSGSGRSRQGEAYASPQDYFTPREDSVDSNYARAMSPTSPTGAQYQQGAGHRYRQPPQNRSQYQPAPPSAVAQSYPDQQQSRQRVHSPSNAYQNPYAAFAEDDTASLASKGNAYPAGQAQYNDYRNERRQQQQYQNQGYSSQQSQYQQDSYFPEQSRYQQQQPQRRQDDHSAPYNNYRQY